MKRRLLLMGMGTVAVVLAVHSGLSLLIAYYGSLGGPAGDIAAFVVWTFVLDALISVGMLSIGLGRVFSPLNKITQNAAVGVRAETNYPELKPIIDMLNVRSEESDKQYKELLADKKFMERAKKSKDEFIANITHEMNTPLTSIIGYSELLKAGGMTEENREKALDTIIRQSGRLHGMISCVINYNEIDNDRLPSYEVNVSELMDEQLSAALPDIEKRGITLIADIRPDLMVNSRVERVNQVLGNLISNAVRYNKDGGKLSVSLSCEDGKITASVSDTGIGISETELGKIFDRFYTVDKSHNGIGGGYGLGLATVKKICKKSGWLINVASRKGEGTTFTVTFKQK